MSLKTEIQSIIESYESRLNTYKDDRAKLEKQRGDYSANKFSELENALKTPLLSVDNDTKNKISDVIESSIEEIKGKRISGSDFQVKLSNALMFINALSDGINDKMALELVMPFLGDFPTMNRLSVVLSGNPKAGELHTTLHALNGYNTLVKDLNELSNGYKNVLEWDTYNDFEGVITRDYLNQMFANYEKKMEDLNKIYMASESDVERVVNDFTSQLTHNPTLSSTESFVAGFNSED
jgi:hypothetical protein